ncbi:tellurite resistance TerB family protein [Rubellimicrobium roseum]|nr:DUF533 domain-containing protein [Rubellimicrobium roseum]
MDTTARSFLDRLLTEGDEPIRSDEGPAAGSPGVGDDPAGRQGRQGTDPEGGATPGGVLPVLLGGRRRALSRSALLAGGVAALGKIALDAWAQARRSVATDPTIGAVEGDAAEARARTLLFAIVAAAKADGHIDEEEHSAIDAEIEDLPPAVKGLLGEAIAAAPDPEAVAARVHCGQEAREVYAASALICGRDHALEMAYLDRLARALDLPSEEARRIEGDVLAHV